MWVGLEAGVGGGGREGACKMVFLHQGHGCGKGQENPGSGSGSPVTSLGVWGNSRSVSEPQFAHP